MMAAAATQQVVWRLGDLLESPAADWAGTAVQGLCLDSRRVHAGDLFLAVPGASHDGRQFIEQAAAAGASAVVAEPPTAGFVDALPVPLVEYPELSAAIGELAARFFNQPSNALVTVGVTGTNGKTSCTRLLGQLLRSAEAPCGVIGTLGCTLDDTVQAAANTTPDAVALQRQLAQWRDAGVAGVAMEVSSHALVQGRVNGTQFDVAVFTNLSRDHLDYHGSMEAYRDAKARLFRMPGLGCAVINVDDEAGRALAASLPPAVQRITVSAAGDAAATVTACDVELRADGFSATISSPWGEGRLTAPLPGEFNVDNVLLAVAAAAATGAQWSGLLGRCAALSAVPGRMELVSQPQDDVQVVVDYAHTPDALERTLRSLQRGVSGRLICVFGCGGDRDRGKRRPMAHIATRYSDHSIITSDNPRTEDPDAILADVAAGASGSWEVVAERGAAITAAIAAARPGDCVLIAGKGHEDYQIVGTERRHFSDKEQAVQALQRGSTP